MRKERKDISLASIQLNTGQLDWLPTNPRTWTQTDIDATRDSILEDPDFLEDRPLLVVTFGKVFISFAGNLRHEGATAAKMSKVPCVVYYPESEDDYDTVKRRAMKDNGSFGAWDYDTLANEWGDLPLTDWGVPAWEEEAVDEEVADEEAPTERPDDFEYEAKYGVIINCKDEVQQKELYESLTKSGLDCKVVTV